MDAREEVCTHCGFTEMAHPISYCLLYMAPATGEVEPGSDMKRMSDEEYSILLIGNGLKFSDTMTIEQAADYIRADIAKHPDTREWDASTVSRVKPGTAEIITACLPYPASNAVEPVDGLLSYDDCTKADAGAAEQWAATYIAKVGFSKETMKDAVSTLRAIILTYARRAAPSTPVGPPQAQELPPMDSRRPFYAAAGHEWNSRVPKDETWNPFEVRLIEERLQREAQLLETRAALDAATKLLDEMYHPMGHITITPAWIERRRKFLADRGAD